MCQQCFPSKREKSFLLVVDESTAQILWGKTHEENEGSDVCGGGKWEIKHPSEVLKHCCYQRKRNVPPTSSVQCFSRVPSFFSRFLALD